MIFKLNKEIYPKKAIRRSINFYKKIAKFKLKETKNYYIISGKVEKEKEELIMNEFVNFVLGIIRQ
ncbi:MAG: HxsD-like protein [Spirochaetes bacterium]|nr:HxsD-like protein [Spirochaetota bacterium]